MVPLLLKLDGPLDRRLLAEGCLMLTCRHHETALSLQLTCERIPRQLAPISQVAKTQVLLS